MIETIQRIQQLAEPNALGAITNAALCRCDNLHHPTCPCGANILCNECDTTIYGQDENWVRNNFEKLRELVRKANDIYRQVGVTLDIGDRISITNIPQAYNILFEGTTNTMWTFQQLVDLNSGTDGLELYFVNAFFESDGSPSFTAGANNGYGLVLSSQSACMTLAHEIGHGLGLKDVYLANSDVCKIQDQAQIESVKGTYVSKTLLTDDWSGGCDGAGSGGARYYRYGTTLDDVLPRILMYGFTVPTKRDIPAGRVYGVWYEWAGDEKI